MLWKVSMCWARKARNWFTLMGLGAMLLAAGMSHADPTVERYARQFFPGADRVGEFSGNPPAAPVSKGDRLMGYVLFTDEIAPIPAYSGKPVRTLVGLDTAGHLTGARIVSHAEPILAAGVSEEQLANYVNQYAGKQIATAKIKIGGEPRAGYSTVDGITGATITAMVINASIERAAKQVAASREIPFDPSHGPPRISIEEAVKTVSPDQLVLEGEPLWIRVWQDKYFRIVVLAIGLLGLAGILVFQDMLTRHPTLLTYVRTGYLVFTLVFIGWYALGQLSVINVLTFSTSLMRDFHWDTFLIDPMLFILWSFVAVALLLWGRGVYCGWLCPFGALQELVNKVATKLGLVQLEIPAAIHERLLAIKYVILLGLFALALQSMADAVLYAEVEPFKTAINMHFQREWKFVMYAGALVLISAFNGKFYCKYLCALGAALTIPAHFRIFDWWLRRRKECGRPCQICAVECPSQAIRPTGEINQNECHYCLDCQVTYYNAYKCPPLAERRKRHEKYAKKAK